MLCNHHQYLLLMGTIFCSCTPLSLPPYFLSVIVFKERGSPAPPSPSFPKQVNPHCTASLYILLLNQCRKDLKARCWFDHMLISPVNQVSMTLRGHNFSGTFLIPSSSAWKGTTWVQGCISWVWIPEFAIGSLRTSAGWPWVPRSLHCAVPMQAPLGIPEGIPNWMLDFDLSSLHHLCLPPVTSYLS